MDFESKTQKPYDEAILWSKESVELNLGTMRKMVDQAASATPYAADAFVSDAAKLMLGAQRDVARMMSLWGAFATALIDLDVK
jgi:hypothetical protein